MLVPSIVAAVLLASCSRAGREPEPVAEVGSEPRASASVDDPCVVGETRSLLPEGAAYDAIGLSHGPGGTVLVAAVDESTLAWVRLDASRAPGSPLRSSLPRARGLVAAAPWGRRTVAIGHGPCPEEARSATCLHVTALDGDRALEAVSVPLAEPIERIRIASSEDVLLVARSHASGPPFLDRFRVAGGRLVSETARLGDARFPGDLHAEVLAVAASGEAYAVAIRVGAIENPEGALVLATPEGLAEIEALHEAAMVDALAIDSARAREVAILASFEWSRPRVFHVDARGDGVGDFVEIPYGASVGPPFPSGEVGRLDRDATGLLLRRATLAGDRLGPPARIAGPALARAAIVRRADDYLVALAPRGATGGVETLSVRCQSP